MSAKPIIIAAILSLQVACSTGPFMVRNNEMNGWVPMQERVGETSEQAQKRELWNAFIDMAKGE